MKSCEKREFVRELFNESKYITFNRLFVALKIIALYKSFEKHTDLPFICPSSVRSFDGKIYFSCKEM